MNDQLTQVNDIHHRNLSGGQEMHSTSLQDFFNKRHVSDLLPRSGQCPTTFYQTTSLNGKSNSAQ